MRTTLVLFVTLASAGCVDARAEVFSVMCSYDALKQANLGH